MVPEHLRDFAVIAGMESEFPGAAVSAKLDRGELTVEISPESIVAVCGWLKDVRQFDRLADLTAVDWPSRALRFEVVYHLHSLISNQRLRLKCSLAGDAAEIDSITSVWRSANWHEREVFDLFGIRFRNHPDLKRIMMPEDWDGHPLRKDYPVHGGKYSYKDE
jgi:NADH-quinone oxidoreductase subunit C